MALLLIQVLRCRPTLLEARVGGRVMVNGLGSDLVLLGLALVAVAAVRALQGSNGMRRVILGPTMFTVNLMLDLAV